LLYNTGLLLQKVDRHEDAAKYYREALAASPEFPEAQLNLGIALKAMGEEEEARSHWRKALKAKPELAVGYFE
ncbi:MAG: tetratricopeptide repeat protein, partial [Bryobacteraceae bacterium]